MSAYTIYVWDNDQNAPARPPTKMGEVEDYLENLISNTAGKLPSPRLERLVRHLLAHFPLPIPRPGLDASDEEIEAYHDQEPSIWHSDDPVQEVRTLENALWIPDIDGSSMAEFLRVLLPKARELHLCVLDDAMGALYVSLSPFEMYTVPTSHSEMRLALDPGYKQALDPAFAKKARTDQQPLADHANTKLALVLQPHGFSLSAKAGYEICWVRELPGCSQIILGVFNQFTQFSPYFTLDLELMSASHHAPVQGNDGQPMPQLARLPLMSLRLQSNPGWKDAHRGGSYARNREELDWIIEDVVAHGLPWLDQAANQARAA
jgi:hypothetical protein